MAKQMEMSVALNYEDNLQESDRTDRIQVSLAVHSHHVFVAKKTFDYLSLYLKTSENLLICRKQVTHNVFVPFITLKTTSTWTNK